MARRYIGPDQLALDAAEALKAGMSYGRWKAMQSNPVQVEQESPEGWKECVLCGKLFKPSKGNQKYCEFNCQRIAREARRREKHNEYNRKWRAKQKEGAVDG